MPLINTSVANLIQGVSQQPDSSRYDGQCEEQENALSSVVDGLKKRPNTRHIAEMVQTAIGANSFVQFVNRSDTEKYVIIHTGDTMYAYNTLSGAAASIWYDETEYTNGWTIPADHYLRTASSARDTLKGLVVGDSTFLVNKDVTVTKDSENTDALVEEAIVTVLQGDYEKRYQVFFGNSEEQGAVINLTFQEYDIKVGYGAIFTIAAGESLNNTGSYAELQLQNVTLISGGTGYPENLTNDSSTVTLRITNEIINNNSTDIPLTISTNSAGEITSVSATTGQYFTSAISTELRGGTSADSLGSRTVKTGAADASGGGANADTALIAEGLASSGISTATTNNINSGSVPAEFSATNRGSVVKYARTDGESFSLRTSDGLADSGLSLAYNEVSSLVELPERNFNNFQVKIVGDAEANQDDYYVKFETADGSAFGVGSYSEVSGFDISRGIDNTTFPHRLVNDELNSFIVQDVPLDTRKAGDDDSNPMPSFVDKKINGLLIYKNRLGVLSEDNIIFSESGSLFNFFRTTVTSLLDSAPIDVTVSSKNVTNIYDATAFQENLILFSEEGQFVLKGGDLLTPKTVAITPVTNFDVDNSVSPLSLGSYIYFPFTRGVFTGIREYSVNSTTDNYDSADITEHVHNYVPKNITGFTGTTTEDLLAITSADEPSSLFVYKYFWSGAKKLLSSWSKFTFQGEIRGIEFMDDSLYMVITLNNRTHVVSLPFESGTTDPAGFLTHLDMRVSRTVTAGSDAISLPYNVTSADNLQVWTKDGAFLQSSSHLNSVQLAQPVESDTEVWVGLPYTMKYTFSEQLFKAAAGQAKSPSNIAKLMLRNVNLFYSDTAAFDVKVTPKFRDTFTSSFTPMIVGASTLGTLALDSGAFRVPVFTKAAETVITIESDSALPCSFQSAEFESFVHSRSNRYN